MCMVMDLKGRKANKNYGMRRHAKKFSKAYWSFLHPVIKARFQPNRFRPVIAFLFTDLNCNLDCYYCYSRGKKIPGMTLEVAKNSIDLLRAKGCRVLAYMGGEPLLRKNFIIDLTRYAHERGFFIYLPTNGIFMDETFVDEIGDAGVAAVNIAIDAVDGYEGIPKAFNRIKSRFEYLVKQADRYEYVPFLNINITNRNLQDVKELTELAFNYGIAADYHINEPPLIKYETYEHENEGAWITENEFQEVDALIDWLIHKNLNGYTMVNSINHLKAMKLFIRGQQPGWTCRAGQLSMVIRLDGSFARCFEFYEDKEDWGNICDGPKFDRTRLAARKQECNPHCLSTCNFQVSHYTQSILYGMQWVAKHVYGSLFGIS